MVGGGVFAAPDAAGRPVFSGEAVQNGVGRSQPERQECRGAQRETAGRDVRLAAGAGVAAEPDGEAAGGIERAGASSVRRIKAVSEARARGTLPESATCLCTRPPTSTSHWSYIVGGQMAS